jgi:hypothetical protein
MAGGNGGWANGLRRQKRRLAEEAAYTGPRCPKCNSRQVKTSVLALSGIVNMCSAGHYWPAKPKGLVGQ